MERVVYPLCSGVGGTETHPTHLPAWAFLGVEVFPVPFLRQPVVPEWAVLGRALPPLWFVGKQTRLWAAW